MTARWCGAVPFSRPLRFPTLGLGLLGALFILTPSHATSGQEPDPQQLFRDALEAQQHGDAGLAVRRYEELIRLHPDMVEARANLGTALVSLGRFDEAASQFRAALAQAPSNLDLRLDLAFAYYKKGDLSDAAEQFSSLHEAEPGDVRIATLLGDCYARLGRDSEVISVLTPIEAANPHNLALAWSLGYALIRAGRAQEGVRRIERVAQQGHSAQAYMFAAQTYLKLGALDQARRDLDATMRLNAHLPGLYTLRGMIMDGYGDEKAAMAAFEKALEANPDDVEAHTRLGELLYLERKLDAARLHLDRALGIDPTLPHARYVLALVERAQGRADAAVKDLEKLARDDPDWLAPRVELAALYYRMHRPEDGAKEKKIVDRLTEEQRQRELKSHIISPQIPLR